MANANTVSAGSNLLLILSTLKQTAQLPQPVTEATDADF